MWDVRVCVACLATDVRMYSMSSSSLLQPYQLLAGVQFGDPIDYLPQKLCWECAALVNKFNLFRHKCERAYLLLQDIYHRHDEILEQHVNNEINREQHLLTSSLGITHIPSYTPTIMKDTGTELMTCSVKTEVDTVQVKYSCPKTEPVFKSEPFVNCDDQMNEEMVDNLDDEGVGNDMNELFESKGEFKYELNVTKAEALPLPSFSGKKEAKPPEAWTEIIMTQEQANQIYEEKKNSKKFQKATLKCELCYQVYKQQQNYTKHMLKHDPVGNLRLDTSENPPVLIQCEEELTNKLRKSQCFSSGSYECDFCKLRYKTRRILLRHRIVHMRNYKCNICNTTLISLALAQSHFHEHQKFGPVLKQHNKKSRQRTKDKREAVKRKVNKKRKVKKIRMRGEMKDIEAVESLLTPEEMMAVVQERQLAKGYDTAPFKCHLCFKFFLENRTYSQHMTLHDPVSGQFECDICKIRLRTRTKVFKHITSGHTRKYTCNVCSNLSYSRSAAVQHHQQHRGVRFMCHVCAKTFREAAMQLHMRAKHPSFTAYYVCGECGSSFLNNSGLALHKTKMHQVATLPEENAPYCEECKVQFASRKAWTKHVLTSERHKDLQKDIENGCHQCGETFHTFTTLRRHKKEQHPNKNVFYKASTLSRMKRSALPKPHVASKPQPCALCGEWMESPRQRWEHHRRRHPGEPYPRLVSPQHPCEQCGKCLFSKAQLEQHKAMHRGPPPLQCSICPKAFYMKMSLNQHISVTHSEERPYQCDACDKSFKLKAALKRHLMVHTGEKPYTCTICEKAFTSREWMRSHVRKVHNKEHIPTKPRIRKRKPPV